MQIRTIVLASLLAALGCGGSPEVDAPEADPSAQATTQALGSEVQSEHQGECLRRARATRAECENTCIEYGGEDAHCKCRCRNLWISQCRACTGELCGLPQHCSLP
jgi:hypothetical protein